jgi:hypothetical protein
MPEKKVLTRNGGTWSEARYHSFIKGALRQASVRWGPRLSCIKRARVSRGVYKCEKCETIGPATLPPKEGNKNRIKNIIADHIDPVIDPSVGFVSWDSVIERMFAEEEGWQAICHACHSGKSGEELEIRIKARNNKTSEENAVGK